MCRHTCWCTCWCTCRYTCWYSRSSLSAFSLKLLLLCCLSKDLGSCYGIGNLKPVQVLSDKYLYSSSFPHCLGCGHQTRGLSVSVAGSLHCRSWLCMTLRDRQQVRSPERAGPAPQHLPASALPQGTQPTV